jgi:hypothetical protein
VTFTVGPVPVVLTSQVTIGLNGSAGFCAGLTTGVTAGLTARAGVGWVKGSGFYPIGGLTPSFSFQPPTLTAAAHLGANVVPRLAILLYGAVGPEVTLSAGLSLDATPSTWTLTAPVSLSARLAIPLLKLNSPAFNIFSRTFPLANGTLPGPPNPRYRPVCTIPT